jgi:hypothetical protein
MMRNSKSKKAFASELPAADILLRDYNFNLKYCASDTDKK